MSDSDVDQVAGLFTQMGASPDSARVMAAQLLKRAGQIASEQGITTVEALDPLLREAIRGRQGLPPSDLPSFGTSKRRD